MSKLKIEVPKGKKAEWVNNVLTLVDDGPEYEYKVLSASGVMYRESYSTREQAESKADVGEHVVKVQKEKVEHFSGIKMPDINWDFLSYIVPVLGLVLCGFGIYRLIIVDNDATTFPLWAIISCITVGGLLAFFGFKR